MIVASDGEQGVALAAQALPDLILPDVMMPEMDGIQLLEHIQRDPVLCEIPVVMISALVERAKALKGHDAPTTPAAAVEPVSAFAARCPRRPQARLIREVYEADPLECPQCRGPMRVIARAKGQQAHLHACAFAPQPPRRTGRAKRAD